MHVLRCPFRDRSSRLALEALRRPMRRHQVQGSTRLATLITLVALGLAVC
jgi:hypothetical protein